VALIKTAPNKANAIKFIEWMVGPHAQELHANATYEYPMRAGVPINKTIATYGELKKDPMPLAQIAANRKKASELVDKVGFNN
jgi:iron(III) transport system substrate-binding protein